MTRRAELIVEAPPEKLLRLRDLRRQAAEQAQRDAARYISDPSGWAEARLGRFLWSKQREIGQSVVEHRYTAVHSAHSTGKSFDAATLGAWWIDVHAPGEAFFVSTAPSFPQVRAVLWREIARAHKAGGLVGRLNQTEWWINDEIVGLGRKPADYDPAAFQGIHARYVLVVIDEACGVPRNIWDAVDTLVTNDDCRVLAIGNPDDSASHFAEVCKPGSGWNPIHVDGLESPNFTDEEIPDDLRPLLLSKAWVEERKERWGETSPLYVSKVRGLFPEDSDDGVVRASRVAYCRRAGQEHPPDDLMPVELGVDPAGGGDIGVIRERRGVKAGRVWRDHSSDTTVLTGLIVRAINETGATKVKIDEGGLGQPIRDRLRELRREGVHQAEIIGVNFGGASSRPKQYPRFRHQLWFEVGRQLSEDGAWDLSDREVDDDTIAQLLAPQWHLDSAGRTVVEDKDETRKRIGRSPDDADALLLAFLETHTEVTTSVGQMAQARIPVRSR